MTLTIDRLPFDALFNIASTLQLDDIVHLGYTCRQLKVLLHENTLCRKAIEVRVILTSYASEVLICVSLDSCPTQQRSTTSPR